ncbi:MAG: ABC transporter permease, partial [Pseudomonadota bacterium]
VPMVCDLWRYRELIARLTWLEVTKRYKGSLLGLLWSILTPLAMLAVYTFAFSVILQIRWTESGMGHLQFAMALFAGLIAFDLFSRAILSSSDIITGHSSYVKRMVFPTQVLPVVGVASALVEAVFKLAVLLVWALVAYGGIPWTWVFLPLGLLPLILLSLGLSWIIALAGVYLRDLGHFVGIAVQMLFFLTPIFYPLSAVPSSLRLVALANPLASVVASFRDMLLWGRTPDWIFLVLWTLVSLVLASAGHALFMSRKMDLSEEV